MFLSRNNSVLKYFNLIIVNLSILLFLIIIVELFMGSWFRKQKYTSKIRAPKNIDLIKNISLKYPSEKSFIRYTIDKYGFRGDYGDIKDINILAVGGSTTDQINVSNDETWTSILQNHFLSQGKIVNIANAGIMGQSSFGHINNFKNWFNTIEDLQPDYIIYYIGINDFYRMEPFKQQDEFEGNTFYKFKVWFASNSIFFDLYMIIQSWYHAKKNELDHVSQYLYHNFTTNNWDTSPLITDIYSINLDSYLLEYGRRLDILHEKTKDFGSKAIFVSQSKRGRYEFVDSKLLGRPDAGYFEGKKINGIDYYNLQREINNVTKKTSEKNGDLYVDLFNEIDFDLRSDFYDTQHVTPAGSKKIADFLFKKLKDLY